MATNKKKINIRLPYYIYRQFDQYAYNMGVPKSRLIRKWLKETEKFKVSISAHNFNQQEKNINFSFQLAKQLNQILKGIIDTLDMSINSFFKFLILSNIPNNNQIRKLKKMELKT